MRLGFKLGVEFFKEGEFVVANGDELVVGGDDVEFAAARYFFFWFVYAKLIDQKQVAVVALYFGSY